MPGLLNLQDADLKGFEALDAGRYNAEVFEVSMDAVKNTSGQGKMPAGTPMVKFQFKLLSNMAGETEGIKNRRVFTTYVIPPQDYDKGKAAKMKGMLARTLIAVGEDEAKVTSKGYDPDLEDLKDRPCVVTINKEAKKDAQGNIVDGEFNNRVTGVRPAGDNSGSSGGLL